MSEVRLEHRQRTLSSQPKLRPIIYNGGCKIRVSIFFALTTSLCYFTQNAEPEK